MDETGQPYAYTGDDPANWADSSGLAAGHLSAHAVCSDEHARKMTSCVNAETQREERGPFTAYDSCELSRPEALGLLLFVATGGLGDVAEGLGEAATISRSALTTSSFGQEAIRIFPILSSAMATSIGLNRIQQNLEKTAANPSVPPFTRALASFSANIIRP